jgi:asparagine synthase (glutamine-hydrolysing)
MCGIAGFLGGDWHDRRNATRILERMNAALRHRGPDGSGIWTDNDARVGFAHDRLNILDLSPTGKQPMLSHSGRYVINYNGEIYNHLELRRELAGEAWRGTSDTESLLQAIERFGTRGAVERASGMFAFALWDREKRSLTLARDRVGEKPLYYGRQGAPNGVFLFASELRAIAQHPLFAGEIDRNALTLLLRHGCIPAPHSIYRGIHKLPPASLLTINSESNEAAIEPYWSGSIAAREGTSDPISGDQDEIARQLEATLELVIGEQVLADVPVGAFLSGGIDSSTIVALMQKMSRRPVKTFTIGFHDKKYDEAKNAAGVARHLGTDHLELYVSPQEARSVIPDLPSIYDEPFADSSQIPTYLISKLARREITVALSGDGGDELFGGYTRHLSAAHIWSRLSRLPRGVRGLIGAGLLAVPVSAWSVAANTGGALLPRSIRSKQLAQMVRRGAPLLSSGSLADLYSRIVSMWPDPAQAVIGGGGLPADDLAAFTNFEGLTPAEQFMAADLVGYLPNDILAKVDRASMAVSLETRMPFLDHRMIEFAWRIPFSCKMQDGETKAILRRLLYRYVPKPLVDRPKMGFAAPIDEWLKGPLRDWGDALLDPRLLRDQGFFRSDVVSQVWRDHLAGSVNEQRRLWPILIFQSWLGAQIDDTRRAPAGTEQRIDA